MLSIRTLLLGLALLVAPLALAQLTAALTIIAPATSVAPPASEPATTPASAPATSPALDPNNCVWQITVHALLDNTKDLNLYIVREKGQFTIASAEAPKWNRSAHTVDASQLQVNKNKIQGPVTVTLIPDNWIPENRTERKLEILIAATVNDDKIAGSARVTVDNEILAPKITGQLVKPRDPKNTELNLSCEEVLNWGEIHAQRIEFAIEFRNGKIIPLVGKTHAFKLATESLPFTADKLKLTDKTLTGTISLTLNDDEGVAQHVTITVDAKRAGDLLFGTTTSKIADDKFTGPLRGLLLPLEDQKK